MTTSNFSITTCMISTVCIRCCTFIIITYNDGVSRVQSLVTIERNVPGLFVNEYLLAHIVMAEPCNPISPLQARLLQRKMICWWNIASMYTFTSINNWKKTHRTPIFELLEVDVSINSNRVKWSKKCNTREIDVALESHEFGAKELDSLLHFRKCHWRSKLMPHLSVGEVQ